VTENEALSVGELTGGTPVDAGGVDAVAVDAGAVDVGAVDVGAVDVGAVDVTSLVHPLATTAPTTAQVVTRATTVAM
jgi:hypothetical protein